MFSFFFNGSSGNRWIGIGLEYKFFEQKLPELKQARDEASGADDGQSRLYGVVLDEVIETFERQLSEIEISKTVMRQVLQRVMYLNLNMLLWQI